MRTFKQFVVETELRDTALRLFFQSRMHLSKPVAQAAVEWWNSPSMMSPRLPEDGWDHIVDWANDIYMSTQPKDRPIKTLHDIARGAVSLPALVRGVIAREFRNRVDESELSEKPFMLALRKEFGLTRLQAEEVIAWFKNEKDWDDLEHDARGPFIEKWDPDTPDLHHPGMSYGDFVMDEIHMAMKKYNIDTRDFG